MPILFWIGVLYIYINYFTIISPVAVWVVIICFPSGVSPVTPRRAGIRASGVTENSSIPASTSHFANSGLVEGRFPQRPKWKLGFSLFLRCINFWIRN